MTAVTYIGDPYAASAFRLAGAAVVTPAAGAESAAIDAALPGCDLLLLSADVAAALPAARLAELRMALRPLLLELPDLASGSMPAEPLSGLQAQLGIEP